MRNTKLTLVICALVVGGLLAAGAAARAYTLTTTVTTDGAASSAGGSLSVYCRTSSTASWGSCGSSVAAGTQVLIYANPNPDYWFMWFTTNPNYLPGCTTLYGGWGYGSNPNNQCSFTMPASNASVNAEFQVP